MAEINTDPEEFRKFHELLTKDEPGYEPFYFCLQRNGKDPRSRGSWKKEKKSFNEAYALMKKGFNIGIAATDEDRLVIVDIDNMDVIGEPKPTLKNVSRKRIGRHCFYFSDDEPVKGEAALFTDSAKQNIATEDFGEVRANWQYVVAAGSFVPCSEEEIERIPEEDRENAGKYAVFEPLDVSSITYTELPETYRAVRDIKQVTWKRNQIKQEEKDRKKTNERRETKKSRLWDLDIYDVSGLRDTGPKRIPMPSEIHGSETGGNCSVNNGVLTCWRHNVTHGALTYLAVLAGVSNCSGAGYDHGTRGSSDVDFEDPETVFKLWEFAKSRGIIPADDPMPSQAMIHLAIQADACKKEDIEDGWKLPKPAYNKVIEVSREQGINPGRTPIETRGRPKKKKNTEEEKIRLPFDGVGDRVLKKYHIFTTEDTQENFIYRNGIYTSDGTKAFLDHAIREEFKEWFIEQYEEMYPDSDEPPFIPAAKTGFVSEVLNYIHAYRYKKRKEIPNQSDRICLQNGIFDLNKWELEPHNPEEIFLRQIPVTYDPEAKCPEVSNFLSSVVGSEEDLKVLIEWVGYCMVPDTRQQKALMLQGTGSNGKSVFLNFVNEFIGTHNISKESLQKLENDKFSVANLFGKLLNVFADLPDAPLYKNDTFNMLVGDDKELRGEKKYCDPFTFENTARLMFSANDLPYAKSNNYAYYRRWIIIQFPNKFEGKKKNKKLGEKLVTEEEKSGFLNLALEGLKRLRENDEFSYTKTVEEIETIYLMNSDPVAMFAKNRVLASVHHTPKYRMYEAYVKYAQEKKMSRVFASNKFAQRMKKLGYTDVRINVPGSGCSEKESYWENCSLEEDMEYIDGQICEAEERDHKDTELLKKDLINYARSQYNMIVENVNEFTEGFLRKYPGYKEAHGVTYITDYANILKTRGWN